MKKQIETLALNCGIKSKSLYTIRQQLNHQMSIGFVDQHIMRLDEMLRKIGY